MVSNPLGGVQFPRGTLCALIGFALISFYYLRSRRNLRRGPERLDKPGREDFLPSQAWPELRCLQVGATLSVLFFLMAGAADAGNDWLYRLAGAFMGLCGALAVAMLGMAFVFLTNLWKELVLQLRKAAVGSLLVSTPLAIVMLAMGLGAFVLVGMLAEKLPKVIEGISGLLLWILIALMFGALWSGRSHAALMARLILLTLFSAIMFVAAAFAFWWAGSQTAPLLVILLTALGSLNVVFYSSFVRGTAPRVIVI